MSSQPITSRLAALRVLGLEEDATEQEIVKAYRKAALRTHPDKPSGSADAFLEVQQAYAFLTEPTTAADPPAPTFEDLIANIFREFNLDPSAKVTVTTTTDDCRKHKKAQTCRFWNGTAGSCRNGKNCRFPHPTTICTHFNTKKGCRYGDGCKFLHVKCC